MSDIVHIIRQPVAVATDEEEASRQSARLRAEPPITRCGLQMSADLVVYASRDEVPAGVSLCVGCMSPNERARARLGITLEKPKGAARPAGQLPAARARRSRRGDPGS